MRVFFIENYIIKGHVNGDCYNGSCDDYINDWSVFYIVVGILLVIKALIIIVIVCRRRYRARQISKK